MENLILNRRGSTLAYVMIVMTVVFIVVSAVVSLTQANIKQASDQESGMQAYYIARSGAELAYEVINTTSYLNEFGNGTRTTLTQNDIDFDKGTANVSVAGNTQVITISAIGKLKDKNISRTVKLQFFVDYPNHPEIIWSN